jgi:hypothetical protein
MAIEMARIDASKHRALFILLCLSAWFLPIAFFAHYMTLVDGKFFHFVGVIMFYWYAQWRAARPWIRRSRIVCAWDVFLARVPDRILSCEAALEVAASRNPLGVASMERNSICGLGV